MVAITNQTGRRVTLQGKVRDVWCQYVCKGLLPDQTFNAKFDKCCLRLSTFYRVVVIAEDGEQNLGSIKKDDLLKSHSITLSMSDSERLVVLTEVHRKPPLLRRLLGHLYGLSACVRATLTRHHQMVKSSCDGTKPQDG